MKLKVNLKKQEASAEADIEGLIAKRWDFRDKNPESHKTRYQIRQEEKRKNKELEQKHFMQGMTLMAALVVFLILVAIVASVSGI